MHVQPDINIMQSIHVLNITYYLLNISELLCSYTEITKQIYFKVSKEYKSPNRRLVLENFDYLNRNKSTNQKRVSH